MKVMSDGIQKASGGQLRSFLRRLTRNPLNGIVFGTIFTGLLQSSSATTVMIISLVNAGLISVSQSVGLIMGANIGTTITAWIVSLGGFLFKLSNITLPILAIAVPFYFRANKKNRVWAEVLIGFSLLFIGLDFLKTALPSLQNQDVYDYIKSFMSYGFFSNFIFVLIGVIVTLLVQSSSASMTLTLAMVYNGWLPIELAAYMIVGENIGTCFTAEVAAFVGNINSRRSARIHTLFNIIGSVLLFVFVPFMLDLIESISNQFSGLTHSFESKEWMTIGLAAFHTSYNLINSLLLIPFIPYLIKLSEKLLPKKTDRQKKEKEHKQQTITMSELSPVEIQHQFTIMGAKLKKMINNVEKQFKTIESETQDSFYDQIKLDRASLKRTKQSIDDKTFRYANSGSNDRIRKNVRVYFQISQNLDRVSDHIYSLSLQILDKTKNKTWITPDQRTLIFQIFNTLQLALDELNTKLKLDDYSDSSNQESERIETLINSFRDKSQKTAIENKDNFDFNLIGTLLFIKIVTISENIGDRIYEIGEYMIDSK